MAFSSGRIELRGHNEGFLRIIICVLADITFKQEIQYQIQGFVHVNTNFQEETKKL